MKTAVIWGVDEPSLGFPGRIDLVKAGSFEKQPTQEVLVFVESKSKDHHWAEEYNFEPCVPAFPRRLAVRFCYPNQRVITAIHPGTRTMHRAHVVSETEANTPSVAHHTVSVPDREAGSRVVDLLIREVRTPWIPISKSLPDHVLGIDRLREILIEVNGDDRRTMSSCPTDDFSVVLGRLPGCHEIAELALELATVLERPCQIENIEELGVRHLLHFHRGKPELVLRCQFSQKIFPA